MLSLLFPYNMLMLSRVTSHERVRLFCVLKWYCEFIFKVAEQFFWYDTVYKKRVNEGLFISKFVCIKKFFYKSEEFLTAFVCFQYRRRWLRNKTSIRRLCSMCVMWVIGIHGSVDFCVWCLQLLASWEFLQFQDKKDNLVFNPSACHKKLNVKHWWVKIY